MAHAICFLCTFLLFGCHFRYFCFGGDTIRTGDLIHEGDNDTIVSAGNIFKLGFFTRGDGKYVGIWYCNSPQVIVWVANREKPVPSSGLGTFGIDKNSGDLEVSDGDNTGPYFSTNLTNSIYSQPYLRTAKLYDTGNLVLIEDRAILWESFKHPTDTFLKGMKINENLTLTSWTSGKDPAPGNFMFRPDEGGYLIMKSGVKPFWKSGGEFANSFILKQRCSISDAVLYLSGTTKQIDYVNYSSCSDVFESNSRLWMRSNGSIQYSIWDSNNKTWSVVLSEPQGPCGVYNACGSFGICNPESDKCMCLSGYEPINKKDWKPDRGSGGCKKIISNCTRDDTTKFDKQPVTMVRSNTQVLKNSSSDDNCRSVCQNNCTCQAYSYRKRSTNVDKNAASGGCWLWFGDLIDIQEGSEGDHIINIRDDPLISNLGLNPQPTGNQQRKRNASTVRGVIIGSSVIFAVALLGSIIYISYRRVVVQGEGHLVSDQNNNENQILRLHYNEYLMDHGAQFGEDDKKDIDVPFFELEIILAATNNFSQALKLGQGGFGPVYKGKFPGGQEIAVKRLLSSSGQGLVEFKTEVVLIAKLQHRNLVRLLGYCIKGNERILLYEYMPNKSLDAFIFDEELRMLLNWTTRFDIIIGVARGLLYLHQDSRLRIIHRDMKASNILLDEEMNPKISDFGLARIVGPRETESNTTRVMGTYGYMAPEYAVEGQFSVKSDAFSFGVVVLEIISGRKNAGTFDSQLALSLLGYAWSLWKEEKALTLLDETLVGACNEREVLKCIAVGLLCVQEDPDDRPNMTKVLTMLSSETETFPNPKQPAFVTRKRFYGSTSSSSTKPGTLSMNEITFTQVEGR